MVIFHGKLSNNQMVDFWCHVSVSTCHPSKIAEMNHPSAGLPKDHPYWTRQKLQDCRWFLGARISSSIPNSAKVNHPKKAGGWWKGGWKFHPFLSISAVLNGDGLSENPWAHGFTELLKVGSWLEDITQHNPDQNRPLASSGNDGIGSSSIDLHMSSAIYPCWLMISWGMKIYPSYNMLGITIIQERGIPFSTNQD